MTIFTGRPLWMSPYLLNTIILKGVPKIIAEMRRYEYILYWQKCNTVYYHLVSRI